MFSTLAQHVLSYHILTVPSIRERERDRETMRERERQTEKERQTERETDRDI